MMPNVFIDATPATDREGPWAIVREEASTWNVIAIVTDREYADAILVALNRRLPWKDADGVEQPGGLFLRRCKLEVQL